MKSRAHLIRAALHRPSPAGAVFIDPSVSRECRQIIETLSESELLILQGFDRQYRAPHAVEICTRELVGGPRGHSEPGRPAAA